MELLRVLGLVVSAILAGVLVARLRRRTVRPVDAAITAVLALALAALALAPAAVDPLLTELGFPPGDARRVIGVLVLSNLLVYLLLVRSFARTDRVERSLRSYSQRVAERAFVQRYGACALDPSKLCVVIPAFNEAPSLAPVLEAVPESCVGMTTEVIVVSDGSTDATEEVAAAHGALVVGVDLNQGQGAAVSVGYRVALLRGAAVVATLDADGQYDPAELPRLIEPITSGRADVVHGSRVLGSYESPIPGRAQGVKVLAALTSLMARTRITDPASGFRAFSADALRVLRFREPQFHASEVTIAAVKAGLRVAEVPCTFRERRAGASKKPPLLRYGWGYTRSLLRTWLG